MCKYLAIEFSCKDIAVNTIRVGYVKSQRKIDSRGSDFTMQTAMYYQEALLQMQKKLLKQLIKSAH